MKMSASSFRSRCILLLMVSIMVATAASGQSRVFQTKHNLSVSGPGTIKAATEGQTCGFCHTPHAPAATIQLWNHQPSAATYDLYSSDYLKHLNYATPNQPNQRSKFCLSCHDGTVALGAVYNMRGGTSIQMAGTITTMPAGSSSNLGTSLKDDHPVGFVFDNAKDPELVNRAWPWNTTVQLDPDASNGTVECQTCHDPHDNTNTKFLRMANTNAALCTFCHTKTGWTGSIHQSSTQAYITETDSVHTTVGEWACRDCHKSHNGAGVPYLLTKVEENTCYSSGCHGSSGTASTTKDIQSEMMKTYRHPTPDVAGKHKNPDDATSLNSPNRHAECADCHNGHQAQKGLHTLQSNLVSAVLKGVPGVAPDAALSWTQPSSFTKVNESLQEYQICYTCHSYNAFGNITNGVSNIIGPSGDNITDQAMEFNPANRSAHPVQVTSNAQTGAVAPLALDISQMKNAWNNPGAQTMYCSDCHGNDQPTSATVPQGPHGSNKKFMLTGTGKFWPKNQFNDSLWSLGDVKNNRNNWQNDMFCANCHTMTNGLTFANNVHDEASHQTSDVKCVNCHVTVPHGAKRSRLIGYDTDVQPYNYAGNSLMISGFQKATSPTTYAKGNCMTSCHTTNPGGTYEP